MFHAGQPLSELDQYTFLLEALRTDADGMYAASKTRTFLGLVNHVHIHARNHSITAQAVHYSPALALAMDEHAALVVKKAQLEKDNAAMKTATGKGKNYRFYCWVHRTC